VIIVPQESHLREQLIANEILSHAKAIKKGKVCEIPGVYLSVDSQYMILSANLLAGILYEEAF
jgi:ABC-type Fe3+-hydroxamate transport system substrate-binding protein